MSAGTHAAVALQRRDVTGLLVAAALGMAGVVLTERWLAERTEGSQQALEQEQEVDHGQEA